MDTLGYKPVLNRIKDLESRFSQPLNAEKLRGRSLYNTPLEDGDVLSYNASEGIWKPVEWIEWTPVVSASGSMALSSFKYEYCKYVVLGKLCQLQMRIGFTTGGTASSTIFVAAPKLARIKKSLPLSGWIYDSATIIGVFWIENDLIKGFKYDGANFNLGSDKWILCSGFYEVE